MTQLLIRLFVKDRHNVDNPKVRDAYGSLGSFTGIGCNLLLFAIKCTLGLISGSISIMADAFNNLSDIGSSVITLIGFKMAKKPADPDHPFGHGRIEYMSAFIVSMLILLVGIELLKSSFAKIFAPAELHLTYITIIGLVASILIKLWMFLFNRKLAKTINSLSLKATAQDSLNDCLSTLAVLISLVVCKAYGVNLDAYVGITVALFILWSGISAARDTLSPLLGEPPDPKLIKAIESEILKNDNFYGIHDLIVHNYGPGRCFASVHVEVPEDININLCHEQIDACEIELKETLGIEIVIHMDPISVNDSFTAELRTQVAQKVQTINSIFTIHDFRIVPGEKRTNLVFDVVVPHNYAKKPAELKEEIGDLVKELDKKYRCVINIDYDYTGA